MDENREETSALARALGLDREQARALAARVGELGGLAGVMSAGAWALRDVLDGEASSRFEAVVELVGELLQANELAEEIDGAEAVAAYFRPRLAMREAESFWVLMLDARGRPLGTSCVAQGTLTACLVHPREVFAPALRMRAASIIVVHNHPSGDPTPSEEDRLLTERLAHAGELLGVPLLDHVIVGRAGYRSLGPGEPRLARGGPRTARSAQA